MSNYGIPYQGSKNRILKNVCSVFPKAKNFYDLFGGGGSVTHFMALHRKNDFENFHYNEIQARVYDLFLRAISGEFNYEKFKPEFVDRERFLKEKDDDGYISCVWSFGNNQRDYIFSKEIEPYKKSMHNAIVFNNFDDLAKITLGMDRFSEGYSIEQKRLFLRNKIEYYRLSKTLPKELWCFLNAEQLGRLEQLERLEKLQQLQISQQLERLGRLEQLERLGPKKIKTTNMDYKKVEILNDSIVYCDIPYKNTAAYSHEFNHSDFFDWASDLDKPVYISEFNISDPRFKLIKTIKKRSLMGGSLTKKHPDEKIYINDFGYKELLKRKNK